MRISIWTTSNCNLNCSYCYENNEIKKQKGHLTDEVIDDLLKWIDDKEVELILFHGGEPLLNFSAIKRIVRYATTKFRGIRFGFTTNGTIWDEEITEFLQEYKNYFEGWLSLSIDGDHKTYDLNRMDYLGNSVYQKVRITAKKMMEIFPSLRARVTVTPKTVDKLYLNIQHLINIGFKQISTAFDYFNSNWSDEVLEVLYEEYIKIFEDFMQNDEVEIGLIDELRYRKNLGKCKPSYNVYVDGTIYPCTYVTGEIKFKIGSVKTGINQYKLDTIVDLGNKDNEFCSSCANKEKCIHNRCKLLNKCITTDYYVPSDIGCALENLKNSILIKYKDQL